MDLTPAVPFPPLARFRFVLTARDPIRLPEYAGSAWRGLLGHGLRRTACVTGQPTCGGCLLRRSCAYSTLFEAPATPRQSSYSAPPHPFVLDIDPMAPREYAPGAPLTVNIHLIGAAIAQAPYFVHAFAQAGQFGFGRARARFGLNSVGYETHTGQGDWVEIFHAREGVYHHPETAPLVPPPSPRSIRLRFVTPVRIKRDGHFLGARELTATDLVQALYRRLRSLARQYGETPEDAESFDLHAARLWAVDLEWQPQDLRWHEWTRYSSRQDSLMQFGGLVGAVRLSGPGLAPLWPALWLGQWVHLGKGTTFGLGGCGLESAESVAESACKLVAADKG
jgi:hypothetical protein